MFIKNAKEEMHELRSLYEGDEPHLLKHFRGTSSNSRQPNAGSATRYIGGKQTSTIPKWWLYEMAKCSVQKLLLVAWMRIRRRWAYCVCRERLIIILHSWDSEAQQDRHRKWNAQQRRIRVQMRVDIRSQMEPIDTRCVGISQYMVVVGILGVSL